ncbi:sigma-54 dependent transcriptional regulator [Roseomonas genomospecies 6]|uniref:Sigma-54-dependent Fis family transcriptional regulator n=1 Tax=Roseomonas genomospecies 6 TaxID=214106 RepID=A0A9W7NE89_9PROT|nr:sigma 54-interacting transcriptional regulator [Roseomonas genomospecies 6]KAA0676981.1 sigma-54-dependent Fis family transcriptional regulator [Roseomonas genomospecies 6]
MSATPVLLTWVAVNNDPYERDGQSGLARLVDGAPIPGPTLTLLCDEESPYAGRINDVVLLHRAPTGGANDREERAVTELSEALRERSIQARRVPWDGDDPTDHRGVFEFLREKLPELRRRFSGRELVLHISPGTPSMHTVWVLMAETGFVEPPFTVVKSYRRAERRGRPAVVPVELGIETFYKVYKASSPRQVAAEDQRVVWDPARFQTDAMRRVYAEARRYAQLNVPVLIRGERGTGKTTLAGWIRSNSPFKREEQDTRWPSVACGQYSPETMRAELFGYKRGAFTGATADREGLLAAAHGDTLFLDEVGDISRDLQRLLIKAIEEKRYFALGDDKPRESDFRLLTATNIDELELQRRLDPDFRDRISLLTLELPPLRDIGGELPWLWEAVYEEAAHRAGVTRRRATLGAAHHGRVVAQLRRHPLPGNLRDLFRVAYRILAARNDVDAPMPPAEAVEYGLEALLGSPVGEARTTSMAMALARAFSSGNPIDDLLDPGGRVATAEVLADFRAFIAAELRRIAADRAVPVDELCDVSERSIRAWAKGRQLSSAARKPSSESEET